MATVIPIDTRRQMDKREKMEIIRKRKVLAVRKIFKCARCAFKCDKCGAQLDTGRQGNARRNPAPGKTPYRFCQSCADDYHDYIAWGNGNGHSDYYWHTAAWADEWRLWIDHQKAVDRYLTSREFGRLLNEIKQMHPDA